MNRDEPNGESFLAAPGGSALARIGAMVRRHWYLVAGSWPRLLDLVYWPSVQILLWGFLQKYFAGLTGPFATGASILLAAAILWDLFFRSQISFTIAFLEEIWSRNLGHIMVSPLRPHEFLLSLLLVAFARTLTGLVLASVVASVAFGFSIFSIGPSLIAFYFNLSMFGWTLGLMVAGLVLRYGQGAESLAWALAVGFAPLSAVYYPIATLPDWLQTISRALPPAHVFEGLRALLLHHEINGHELFAAVALNTLYFGGGVWLFFRLLNSARTRGTLLSVGE